MARRQPQDQIGASNGAGLAILGNRARRVGAADLLVLPAILYLLLIFVVPLVMLGASSVAVDGGLSLQLYVEYLSDAYNRSVVWTTIRYALVSGGICLLLGYPFARLMAAAPNAVQALLFAVILLPMSVSIIVRAFGWTILLRRDGLVNELLVALHIIDGPIRLLFTEGGWVLGTVAMQLPLMILPIYVVLRMIPSELDEAGACLGAGPIYRFLHLDLPLAVPGMAAGFSIVFSQCAAAYAIPSILGGARNKTMASTIVDAFLVLQAAATGSTVSVLLLAIVIAVIAATGVLAKTREQA